MNVLTLQQSDLIRLMRGQYMQRVIWVVNLLLVVWIASQLATLTWDVLAPEAAPESVAVVSGDLPARADPALQLVRQLPDWHLMGVVVKEAAPPVQQTAPVDAPDTRLKLVLRGALASDDKQHARAIIADPGGKEEQYAIGDTLPGNAELSEVYPDRVILLRNGRYETLRLPRDNKPGGNTLASFTAGRQPAVSPAQRLQTVRQQLQKSPKSLYGLVRATPQTGEDGSIMGYALAPGRDPELFEQVGLQEGDVVVQVNDIKLDNPANSARALKSVQSGESVSVTVLRGGEEQVLTLNLPE